jgi:DNA repair photolyase
MLKEHIMSNKLTQFQDSREYLALNDTDKDFLNRLCGDWQFSVQQIRHIIRVGRDLETWSEGSLSQLWGEPVPQKTGNRNEKEKRYREFCASWENLKNIPKDYRGFSPGKITIPKPGFKALDDERQILGDCPVASIKTRCCNLKTLDAVAGCGFDCSYCSIQSFYTGNTILFHKDLKQKLKNLNLDPEKQYHIGTGQSSDSLMWGNKNGLLDDLCDFARENPNVILELKTKSDNVNELLDRNVPPNILLTWSLNTQTVIDAEERLTVSLVKRLEAARKSADRGIPVGFHLHPMVWYKEWEAEYADLFTTLTALFRPEEVVTVSIGTLTFIKPVLKKLRERPIHSKILQMPLEEAAGKLSYPHSVKLELFNAAYKGLKPWQKDVFFYMCMEDPELWKPIFGKAYESNADFEEDMIYNYNQKISKIHDENHGGIHNRRK